LNRGISDGKSTQTDAEQRVLGDESQRIAPNRNTVLPRLAVLLPKSLKTGKFRPSVGSFPRLPRLTSL
jgi:hypothetical protein